MDSNKNNNKNASHLTHEMKKNHGDLQTASMKALITQKVDKLNDIRKKQLAEKEIQAEIEEESRKKERESFKRERKSLEEEKKLMEKGFQVEREILEICYNNGYLPQKNKPKIEHDDTIDIEPED
ncbi:hypothetical protein BB463_03535 [Helicobacter pylori]|uniref:Uncharacterized protein n=2 Tax=Helicobacter pylori TaxID=210 RepID=A0A2A6XDD6_HELPX|nr:hypothetical protein [Helicobacter pylori]EJB32754.1 hypothetical protein HPNQ4053_1392 [Helicobacter pylori NQ4053]PDW22752.1 hypothetical protein BB479_02160 [Helicobacter pylori]PDX17321.1 hypothetical protein BB414_00345 [Helicobacter pylori]PDX31924.1 hypothetical protein BB463_03535 [Helicobacter pylori]RPF67496.1 hypothetical protein EGW01_06855 [Helicobacter pylori]